MDGGIPYLPINGTGPGSVNGVMSFDVDHTWVEAYIPMQNYRGAPGDGRGTIWVPMAPAIKELEASGSVNIIEEMTASGNPFEAESFFDAYIESLETRSPVAVFEDSMVSYLSDAHPGMSIEQAKRTFEIKRKSYPILPLTLPAKMLVVRGEYDECPESWRYRVEVKAYSGSDTLLSVTLPLPRIGTRRVVMAFEPETEDDAIAIVEYGGVYNVPAYLVRVTPVFRVAGETVGEGVGGIGLGCRYRVGWRVTGPKGELVDLEMEKTAGMQWGVGFVSGQVPGTLYRGRRDPEDQESPQGRELHEVVMRYWEGAWAGYERFGELWWTWMLHEPDVIVSSTQLGVEQVFGQPVGVSWQGLYVNVHLAMGMVELDAVVSDRNRVARGVALVATATGSWMEHEVFEEKYKTSAISAVKVLRRGLEQGVGVYDIDECNVNEQLAIIDLPLWAENQIRDYVSAGYKAKVPGGQVTQDEWVGVGYVFWNDRGSACYLLQGTRGGGETTDDFDWGGWLEFWLNYYGAPLHPVGLCSTSMEWISPPDSSVWAWGDTIPVVAYDTLFYWCGGVGSGRDTTIRGPDTTWVYSGTCDPKLYHLIPVNYGPDPPESENEPCYHLGEDSLAVWVVKVEVDTTRSSMLFEVPLEGEEGVQDTAQTVFTILPDTSFFESPVMDSLQFFHYLTTETEEGAIDTVKSKWLFELDTLEMLEGGEKPYWVVQWLQQDDDEEWLDPEANPFESHIRMEWINRDEETRQTTRHNGDEEHRAEGNGIDLLVYLPDGSQLPEEAEQGDGSGMFVKLNDDYDAEEESPDWELEQVLGENDLVRIEIKPMLDEQGEVIRVGKLVLEIAKPQGEGGGMGNLLEKVKIWKHREKGSGNLLIGGDEPPSKTWDLTSGEDVEELMRFVGSASSETLWVEGCKEPSERLKDWRLVLSLTDNNGDVADKDEVEGTVLRVDLDVANGGSDLDNGEENNQSPEMMLEEADEEDPGAYLLVNWDDDDGDHPPVPDFDEHPVINEDNLAKMTLTVEPAVNIGKLQLMVVQGMGVQIWDSRTKNEAITQTTWDIGTTTWPVTLWLEACQSSISERDITLELRYRDTEDRIWVYDQVNLTAVMIALGNAVHRELYLGPRLRGHAAMVYKYIGECSRSDLEDDDNFLIIEMVGPTDHKTLSTMTHADYWQSCFGCYTTPGLSMVERLSIISSAKEIMRYASMIDYTWLDALLPANWNDTIEGISELRCDGLVEVCYEINNVNVWGKIVNGDIHYDIRNDAYQEEHNDFDLWEWQDTFMPATQCGHESTYMGIEWETTFRKENLCEPVGSTGGN